MNLQKYESPEVSFFQVQIRGLVVYDSWKKVLSGVLYNQSPYLNLKIWRYESSVVLFTYIQKVHVSIDSHGKSTLWNTTGENAAEMI